ncbi:hypothetical protein KJ855_00075 [Patescibacteria group bacterium]|nr:hypothetical protein [Patescibacteria group bacterium]
MKKILVVVLLSSVLVLGGCTWFGGEKTVDDSQEGIAMEEEVAEEVTEGEVIVEENMGDLEGLYKVDNQQAVLTKAKDLFNLANDLALDWQSDALLLLVSSRYTNSLEDTEAVDKFIYTSDLRPEYYWSIEISRGDMSLYTRTLIFREDYVLKSGVKPIPLKYWQVTYAEALEKADILGGYQFRKDYPNYQVSQMLSMADDQNLAWYVTYSSIDTEDDLNITIDANTGEEIV